MFREGWEELLNTESPSGWSDGELHLYTLQRRRNVKQKGKAKAKATLTWSPDLIEMDDGLINCNVLSYVLCWFQILKQDL